MLANDPHLGFMAPSRWYEVQLTCPPAGINVSGCSLPGVPGQGLLTIFMGVMLIDFPGKHRFERWLVSRRVILAAANRLRAKAGRPPLEVEVKRPA